MKKYWLYFKYIMEHKKNVFLEAKEGGMWWHGVTHDLSKFLPSEFIPYANWFYGEYGKRFIGGMKWEFDEFTKCEKEFHKACEHHYKNNKHHWNYWIGKDMPEIYIRQMIFDWRAMSRKFGDTPQEFYMKTHDSIDMTTKSRCLLEFELGLICGTCLCCNITWKDYLERNGKTMEDDLVELGIVNKKI